MAIFAAGHGARRQTSAPRHERSQTIRSVVAGEIVWAARRRTCYVDYRSRPGTQEIDEKFNGTRILARTRCSSVPSATRIENCIYTSSRPPILLLAHALRLWRAVVVSVWRRSLRVAAKHRTSRCRADARHAGAPRHQTRCRTTVALITRHRHATRRRSTFTAHQEFLLTSLAEIAETTLANLMTAGRSSM